LGFRWFPLTPSLALTQQLADAWRPTRVERQARGLLESLGMDLLVTDEMSERTREITTVTSTPIPTPLELLHLSPGSDFPPSPGFRTACRSSLLGLRFLDSLPSSHHLLDRTCNSTYYVPSISVSLAYFTITTYLRFSFLLSKNSARYICGPDRTGFLRLLCPVPVEVNVVRYALLMTPSSK
jgi:hypothetical protein